MCIAVVLSAIDGTFNNIKLGKCGIGIRLANIVDLSAKTYKVGLQTIEAPGKVSTW